MTRPGGGPSLAATFVTLGFAYGIWYSYSVFLVALLGEFGWSRSLVAGAFSVFVLVHGLAAAPLGWLGDRLGPRRLTLAGGLVLAAGLGLAGMVDRPWQLYLSFGVLGGIGVAAAGWVPAVLLVQRWFPLRVGTALGITSAGIGAGILLMVPFAQWLIDRVGWRRALQIIGVAALAWILPVTFWLVREPPAGATRAGRRTGGEPVPAAVEVTLLAAAATRAFWLLAAAQGFAAFVNQMLLVHQVAYLVDHGVPALVAASVVSVVGIASVVGKAGGGWVSDLIGREVTYTLGMALVVTSIGALGMQALQPGAAWAYVYGGLVGLGYAVTAPLMPAVISDLYRGRHFGAIFGALQTMNAVGGALGPWVAGRVFDATGSYRAAFLIAVVAAGIATTALWIAAPRRRGRPRLQ